MPRTNTHRSISVFHASTGLRLTFGSVDALDSYLASIAGTMTFPIVTIADGFGGACRAYPIMVNFAHGWPGIDTFLPKAREVAAFTPKRPNVVLRGLMAVCTYLGIGDAPIAKRA